MARSTQAGDIQSFDILVRRHQDAMHAFIRQQVGNAEEARDLTQAIMIRAYQRLDRFDGRRPFKPWLFAVARRVLIDHYRARREYRAAMGQEDVETRDPGKLLQERDQAQALWEWVRKHLNPNQFAIFWLRVEEDMSLDEIARIMGRSRTSVKVMLHRIRNRLQHAWPKQTGDETRLDGGRNS